MNIGQKCIAYSSELLGRCIFNNARPCDLELVQASLRVWGTAFCIELLKEKILNLYKLISFFILR